MALQALIAIRGRDAAPREAAPREAALSVTLYFFFARPKSAPKKVREKTTRPDLDKLARSVFDGLTGIVYCDDSQVVRAHLYKSFGEPERIEVRVTAISKQNN